MCFYRKSDDEFYEFNKSYKLCNYQKYFTDKDIIDYFGKECVDVNEVTNCVYKNYDGFSRRDNYGFTNFKNNIPINRLTKGIFKS